MKIGIIGTGGVGGYFGARLASSGNQVTFIARGKHLEAIKKNGLLIKSIKGDITINPAVASDKLNDIADCELIIFGTKAYQIKDIAKVLAKCLNKNAMILPLQNGVLAIEELTQYFDRKQILGGLCMIFSRIESPGIINHMGLEPSITFGEIDKTNKERTLKLKTIFENAEIRCTLTDEIEVALWKKFMLICLSGFGAISNSGYGLVRETPETRQMLIDSLTEVGMIAKVKNIKLDIDIIDKSIAIVDTYPADSMSSLSRDVLSGKQSEIEYQNGTVVRLGKELGIDTPVNKFIYGFVKLLEKKYKNQSV
ncbi:MAG: 2-dehydropantoate 2-reductase [Bacteroidetes bacterium GWF2_33_16]|nr:MAG: 2-dehydropantoate 2-reductase [Bacteroidetes bacterium GWE2_32_14]OFY03033.1 MAG: 2-dehydropantoate 2-reductase [Bacteroidetes bacterium GWF2_33_16]